MHSITTFAIVHDDAERTDRRAERLGRHLQALKRCCSRLAQMRRRLAVRGAC